MHNPCLPLLPSLFTLYSAIVLQSKMRPKNILIYVFMINSHLLHVEPFLNFQKIK